MASFSKTVTRAVLPLSFALTVAACVAEVTGDPPVLEAAQASDPATGPQPCSADGGAPAARLPPGWPGSLLGSPGGYPGYLGYPGYPGYNGYPGYAGYPGYPGYAGSYPPGYLGSYPPGYLGGYPVSLGGYPAGYGGYGPAYPVGYAPGYLGSYPPGYLGSWPGYYGSALGGWLPGPLAAGTPLDTPDGGCP